MSSYVQLNKTSLDVHCLHANWVFLNFIEWCKKMCYCYL